MCGRLYETYTDEELAVRYLNKKRIHLSDYHVSHNVAPTQDVPVVRSVDGELSIDLFRWQFVPPWEKEFKTKLSTINARSESVFESRLFKKAILERRCIVPVSGFFEWKSPEVGPKRPFAIHHKGASILSMAGIYSVWQHDDSPQKFSFAILTTTANSFMANIHTRMPVILDRSHEALWLSESLCDRTGIEALLKEIPDPELEVEEISTRVNSPLYNKKDILDPVQLALSLQQNP